MPPVHRPLLLSLTVLMSAALTGCGLGAASNYRIAASAQGGTPTTQDPPPPPPAATPPPAAAPTVTLEPSASSVASGGSTTLSWVTTGASVCEASGAWSGSRATSGSEVTSALESSSTYALTCTGPGGSAAATAVISVISVTAPGDSTSSALLQWDTPTQNTDGSALVNLIGYHIHYGLSPQELTGTITLTDASATSYEFTGLSAGTWYFAVAADAADGTESALSNIASKTL